MLLLLKFHTFDYPSHIWRDLGLYIGFQDDSQHSIPDAYTYSLAYFSHAVIVSFCILLDLTVTRAILSVILSFSEYI